MYLCDSYITGPQCLTLDYASQCAFGSGRSCSPCPEGGFCPGGARIWYSRLPSHFHWQHIDMTWQDVLTPCTAALTANAWHGLHCIV
jgi:hypothetical protein